MFTDFLNNPVNVGDVVIYPQSQGSSSAHIQTGRIVAMDEIIKASNGDVFLHSKRHKRGEYTGLRYPTKTVPAVPDPQTWQDYDQVDDPTKAYHAKVQKIAKDVRTGGWKEDGKPVTIRNVDRLTVVTSLGDFS
jgi:hypothetical protein